MSKAAGFLNPLYESGKLKGYNKHTPGDSEVPEWVQILNDDYNAALPEQQALANIVINGLNDSNKLESFWPIPKEDSLRFDILRPMLKEIARTEAEYLKMGGQKQMELNNNFQLLREYLKKREIPFDHQNPYNFSNELKKALKKNLSEGEEPNLTSLLFHAVNGRFIPAKSYKDKGVLQIDPHKIRKVPNKSSLNTLIHEGTHGIEKLYGLGREPQDKINSYFNEQNLSNSQILEKTGNFRKYVGNLLGDKGLNEKMSSNYNIDQTANNEVMARLMPNLYKTDWRFPLAPKTSDRETYKQTEHHHNRKLLRSLLKNERQIFGKAGLNDLLNHEDENIYYEGKKIDNMFADRIDQLRKPVQYRKYPPLSMSKPYFKTELDKQFDERYNKIFDLPTPPSWSFPQNQKLSTQQTQVSYQQLPTMGINYNPSNNPTFSQMTLGTQPSKQLPQAIMQVESDDEGHMSGSDTTKRVKKAKEGGYIEPSSGHSRYNRDREYNMLVNYLQRYLR